jgi:hypothetical protein
MKNPTCDSCGLLEYALVDGYGFGDRVLEGVYFEVRVVKGKISVSTCEAHKDYMGGLNEKKWMKEAKSFVKETDVLECPKCHEDIENPFLEEAQTVSVGKPFRMLTITDVMAELGRNSNERR